LAPDVFAIEWSHALTRAEQQGRISASDGWAAWLDVMADAPALQPSLPLQPRAYAVSSRERIGIYDCLYVSLAEREGCQFLTADARLARTLQKQYPLIVGLSSLP